MSVKINIRQLVDEMEMNSFDQEVLIHISTGKFVLVLQEFMRDAEDGKPYDDLPEWHQEQMILAIDILENEDDYMSIPSQFEINEYEMMEKFSYMQKDNIQNKLLHAITGRGAFRRFKDTIFNLDIKDAWFTFREECYRQIAIDFCKRHGLEYE